MAKEARQKLIEWFHRVDVTITPFLFQQRRKTASALILGGCHKQVVQELVCPEMTLSTCLPHYEYSVAYLVVFFIVSFC